jgi:hypothetical protein
MTGELAPGLGKVEIHLMGFCDVFAVGWTKEAPD